MTRVGESRRAAMAAGIALVLLTRGTIAEPQGPPIDPGLDTQRMELRGIEDTLGASEAQRRRIEAEVETDRTERARLSAALIATTTKVRDAEQHVSAVEERLSTMTGSEDAIRHSLDSRRAIVGEVLAALQRLGRKPPPAVVVSPSDMLRTIRTSMLLGAVVPELRAETEALASDLADLVSLRRSIETEHEALAREGAALTAERGRLTGLIETRQATMRQAEDALASEHKRSVDLAKQAANLRDLIARMEGAQGAALRSAESDAENVKTRVALVAPRDPARLSPGIPFADVKGTLSWPVSGSFAKRYGAPDGLGGQERGVSIATRGGAVVSAPTDGSILFSGPWRSYGQLLIINVGGGYYVVLAGMDRIDVEVGQFVLAGEPVGMMASVGSRGLLDTGPAQPILYVEFRKDGVAVDPGPWWAKPDMEKVRG